MANKYDILKFSVGVFNVGYLLFRGTSSHSIYYGLWWKYLVAAIVVLIILMKWVSFIRKNENLWAFIITLIITLPFNIKSSYMVSTEYFESVNLFSRVLYGIVFCMSLLSIEEILVGLVTRIIWRKQNDAFCIVYMHHNKEGEWL